MLLSLSQVCRSGAVTTTRGLIEESVRRLGLCGLSAVECQVASVNGPAWVVTAIGCESIFQAEGKTRADAWRSAVRAAELAGLI